MTESSSRRARDDEQPAPSGSGDALRSGCGTYHVRSRRSGRARLITGGERGTYYQFGLDIQKLLEAGRPGDGPQRVPSKGSVENIYAVYQRPATQMGIVQSDVLAFVFRIQSDPVLRRIARKVKMVFPLYNEEIHILGRKGITDFDDLADRRVAIGREGSGTYLTARILLKMADITPREMVLIDTDEALAELKAGRIDAMFYVAGYPVKLFTEKVAESDGLAFVPDPQQDRAGVLRAERDPGEDLQLAARPR